MLGYRLHKLFWLSLLLYFLYLVVYGCRSVSSDLNAIAQVTCAHLQQLVYPLWDKIEPTVKKWDQSIGVSESAAPIWASAIEKWSELDNNYHLSETTQQSWNTISKTYILAISKISHYQKLVSESYYQNLHPSVCFYVGKYKLYLEYAVDNAITVIRRETWFTIKKIQIWCRYIVFKKICPVLSTIVDTASRNEYVIKVIDVLHLKWVASELAQLYAKLKIKSSDINKALQKKSEFLRDEYGTLDKLDNLRKSIGINTKKNIQMILDLTNDLTRNKNQIEVPVPETPSEEAPESVPEEMPEPFVDESELSDSSDEEDITITLTKTLTETSNMATQYSTLESEQPEASLNEDSLNEDSISNEEDVICEESQTEKESSDSASIDGYNSTDTGLSELETVYDDIVSFKGKAEAQINYELATWEERVKSTLKLAEENLKSDFEPYLTEKLAQLKDVFSANLTQLQSDNYKRYKVMNELILAIDKDSEYIRTNDEIIEEPEVDRQVMRDRIQEAKDIVKLQMEYADEKLIQAHQEILQAYFETAQTTVDVLESFAETTILDFSARLKTLIDYLKHNEDFDDKLSWNAWKKFHQVKESIFQIRDKIFDEALAYKDDPESVRKPQALKEWDEYVRNVNFHIGFLIRDNDEYLMLVRAQANVAYQQREGLIYELTERKAAEKAAAEEAERKAEEERIRKEEEQKIKDAEELERKKAEEAERQKLEQELELRSVAEDAELEVQRILKKEQEEKRHEVEEQLEKEKFAQEERLEKELALIRELKEQQSQERKKEKQSEVSDSSVSDAEVESHESDVSTTTTEEDIITEELEVTQNSSSESPVASTKTANYSTAGSLESVYEPSEIDEDAESEDVEAHWFIQSCSWVIISILLLSHYQY